MTFGEDQFALAYPDGIEKHWWTLARNRIILRLLQRIPVGSSLVFDVGCGRGLVVDYLNAHGIPCLGIEKAEVAPLPSVKDLVRVGMEFKELVEEERRRCRVLLLLDVIEHIPDPVPFLSELVREFSHLDHVLLTVPARQELWSNYDDYYGHHRRYNRQMLQELAGQSRLNITESGYFFHALYLPLRTMLLCKMKRPVSQHPPSRRNRWLHQLFAFGMTLDFQLLPSWLPGSSLYAICSVNRQGGVEN